MLLILYLTSIVGPLLFAISSVSSLPVTQPIIDSTNDNNNIGAADLFANKHNNVPQQQQHQQWTNADDLISPTQSQLDDNDDVDFYVDVNRLTQLLSAHIMAEHLENAVTALSKTLAAQIQNSVQLITQQQRNTNPYYSAEKETLGQQQQQLRWIQQDDVTDGDVDVRLLKEQLQGAVGSYVEDQLPNMWYRHSSFAALDSITLRSFMETTLLDYCPSVKMMETTATGDDDNDGLEQQQQQQQQQQVDDDDKIIAFSCLRPLTKTFSMVVDNYIQQNMHSTLVDIVQQDLPQLLVMTDNHIRAVLNHFNTFLLPPHSQLRMDLLSVQQDDHGWTSVDRIGALLDSITEGENNNDDDNDALPHSIRQYAIHAKTSYYS